MNAPFWILWLAGTLLPLGALWLVYRLALRGERCFGYNRALLLLAPVLAATLPLLPRPALLLWLNSPAVVVAGNAGTAVLLPVADVGQVANPTAGWSVWAWLGVLYLAGVVLGLGRLAWQAGRLWSLARRLPREVRPGYVLAYTGGRLPTSSFGRVIFWDETAALTPAEAAAVLRHELAHVQQRHTRDVLWLEAWRAVLWPNPFSHLLLPALRLTHELLADAAATAEALDPNATPYPTLLARLATRQLSSAGYSALLQPFTFSFTLTRIAMLQNQSPVRRWKQWLVLPVLGALSFVTGHAASAQAGPVPDKPQATPALSEAAKKARREELSRKLREAQHQDSLRTGGKFEPGTKQQFTITNVNKPGGIVVTVTRVKLNQLDGRVTKDANYKEQADFKESADSHVYTYVEQMPQLPGGGNVTAIVKQIQANLVYPAGERKEGRVFVIFTVSATGEVHDARIIKGLSDSYDAATLAAVEKLPRFVPGQQAGQPVAVSFTVPILFKNTP